MWTLLCALAAAAPRTTPAASASEIPELADLLARAGWTPTPELSGIFAPGRVFEVVPGQGHQQRIGDCFGVAATRATYTQAEVTSQLQAGVRVRLGLGQVGSSGSLEKKVSFGTPAHLSVPLLEVEPSQSCEKALGRILDPSRYYVVTEVLLAEILEQTCGRMDATGRFVGLGEAEAKTTLGCSMDSLEPVAVAYRTQPLSTLMKGTATAGGPVVKGDFAVVDLGVQKKLAEQECQRRAMEEGERLGKSRMEQAQKEGLSRASAAWSQLKPQAEACAGLSAAADRKGCAEAVEGWIERARGMSVELPASEVSIQTDCGQRSVAVQASQAAVSIPQLAEAEALLKRLRSGPSAAPAPSSGAAGPLVVVPGVGLGAARVGVSTPADILRAFGEDCRMYDWSARKSDQSCDISEAGDNIDKINYDRTANGDYESSREAQRTRPSDFEFKDGRLVEVHIGAQQRGLKTAEGFNSWSKKSDIEAAWGKPDRVAPGDPLEKWYYDRLGIEVWVYAAKDDTNSMRVHARQ